MTLTTAMPASSFLSDRDDKTRLTTASTFARITGAWKSRIAGYFQNPDLGGKIEMDKPADWEDDFFGPDGCWRADLLDGPGGGGNRTLPVLKLRPTLDRGLAKLPEPVAVVYLLREIEHLDAVDICSSLNISQSDYASMLHRARMVLRAEFVKTHLRTP